MHSRGSIDWYLNWCKCWRSCMGLWRSLPTAAFRSWGRDWWRRDLRSSHISSDFWWTTVHRSGWTMLSWFLQIHAQCLSIRFHQQRRVYLLTCATECHAIFGHISWTLLHHRCLVLCYSTCRKISFILKYVGCIIILEKIFNVVILFFWKLVNYRW